MSFNNRPDRAIASSPGPMPQATTGDQFGNNDSRRLSMRPMRLKVLYTFDAESKTNHLARWPHPIDIQSARLDEQTQIGVIELKTCIQAIAAASPEVVAKLSHDFTVYAYDYSEYETPLVGQGMLSWILASSSATPSAPAHQSRTMVTGRVCKNAMGLFNNNSQETLEVKLRLVPVPTSLQSEYIESMKKYREVSQIMPPGFDPQVWTSFIQANPGFIQQAMQDRSQSPAAAAVAAPLGQHPIFGIEHVQRLLSGERQQQQQHQLQQQQMPGDSSQRPLSRANSIAKMDATPQLPRMPSPALSVQSTASAPKKRGRPPKKPGPKGPRNRAASGKPEPLPQSNDTGYASNDDGANEDGPAKKRAKVMQAEWNGKQDFAREPESLRVAASSAASVRIHQPTPIRPGMSTAQSLEGPPREPTPVGNPMQRSKPLLRTAKSGLRDSMIPEKKMYATPYPSPDTLKPSESAVTSPANSRVDSSPPDMGSSPPVFGGSTAPCSPNLPALSVPEFGDSGFMSGSIDDLFEDDELRPPDQEDFDLFSEYIQQPELPMLPAQQQEERGREGAYPSEDVFETTAEEKTNGTSGQTSRNATGGSRAALNRTASSGDFAYSQVPASDPVRPTGFYRSQTWSGHQAPHPASDVVAPAQPIMESIEKTGSRSRRQSETGSGSGVKRKAAIQSKLATSIAAGEMPPFCENCGSIETPTWRKAWVKVHSGTPEHVRISEEEGGIIAWQTLQTDHTGTVCLYRIVKKSILKSDEGFSEILLCNPCGIFLHSRKCMRPKSAWDKPQRGPDDKGSKGPSGKRPRGGSMSNGPRTERSGSNPAFSERSSPGGGQTDNPGPSGAPAPGMKRPRSSSFGAGSAEGKSLPMDEASAAAALQQAIQASPHKFRGSQSVPIEVGDLTPQPTRRILFPSPSKSQAAQSKANSPTRSLKSFSLPTKGGGGGDSPLADKENRPPSSPPNPNFADFIHPDNTTTPPRNPSSTSKLHPFKTPLRTTPRGPSDPPTTGAFFSSAAKALLRPTHPTLTPKRTPTRSSTSNTHPLAELSPFTAHLNQLLSDPSSYDPTTTKTSPPKPFDFPALPSPTAAAAPPALDDFDFGTFVDDQDLISTDVPMPSSPPVWFGAFEDGVGEGDLELEDGGGLWGEEEEGVEAGG